MNTDFRFDIHDLDGGAALVEESIGVGKDLAAIDIGFGQALVGNREDRTEVIDLATSERSSVEMDGSDSELLVPFHVLPDGGLAFSEAPFRIGRWEDGSVVATMDPATSKEIILEPNVASWTQDRLAAGSRRNTPAGSGSWRS